MNRDQKAAVIEEIAADISASQAIFAIDYRGITVAQGDALRARLREANASFRVVKNSLTERAAEQAGAPALRPLLEGPTALTFVRGDAAAAAKAVADFARNTPLLAFKGGMMDGAALSSAEVTTISRLPSRDVLYGQLVGLIASPIAGLARTLNALIGGLAIGLGGVLEKRQGEMPVAVPPTPAGEPADEVPAGAPSAAGAEAEGAGADEPTAEAVPPAGVEAPADPAGEVELQTPAELAPAAVEPSDEATAGGELAPAAAASTDEPDPAAEVAPSGETRSEPGSETHAAPAEPAGAPGADTTDDTAAPKPTVAPPTDDAAAPEASDAADDEPKEK